MPCEFQAWLASGEFLVSCDASRELRRVRGAAAVPFPRKHERYGQASVAESGTIVLVAEDKDRTGAFCRVIAIDPTSFAETVVSERGTYAEYQFPKASPSGKRVAYALHVPLGQGRYRTDLVVDRTTVAQDILDYEWIDDATLALIRADQPPSIVRPRAPDE